MIDIVEILIHWYAGRSQHELAASQGVDRKTLRKYLGPARAGRLGHHHVHADHRWLQHDHGAEQERRRPAIR